MYASTHQGISALSATELQEVGGGDMGATVSFAIAVGAAMGAGFKWGYETLGPIFNEYF